MRKRSAYILVAVVAFGWFATLPVCGQVAAPEAGAKAGDARAADVKPEEAVREAADFLGKLPAFACKIETVLAVNSPIQKNRNVTKIILRLERPNRLAMIVEEGIQGITIVSDGKKLVQFLPIMQQSNETEAPATFEEMMAVGAALPPTILGKVGNIVGDSGEAIYKKLMTGVTESKFLGEEKVGEVNCRHFRFIAEDMDWDLWIEAGKQPLIRKIAPDLAKQIAKSGQDLGGATIDYTITFSDWNVAPKFTDEDFFFLPPPPPLEPPHALVGQPAPPFATTDLDEKPIDLKAHLGKDVVMLDFWATWCGPCVRAMPQVIEVADKFKEKGLVFYAVNAREDVETIRAFLQQANLQPPVALDPNDEIGGLYKVEGIPQTVLIGKDGKVQVVHVGFSPDLGKTLTKDVEELLAGKDLAKEELEKFEAEKKKREESSKARPAAEEKQATEPAAK